MKKPWQKLITETAAESLGVEQCVVIPHPELTTFGNVMVSGAGAFHYGGANLTNIKNVVVRIGQGRQEIMPVDQLKELLG